MMITTEKKIYHASFFFDFQKVTNLSLTEERMTKGKYACSSTRIGICCIYKNIILVIMLIYNTC